MVSQTISHYQVIKKLGAGGMGEVYLATDTRLDRQVALKLLPAEFTRDTERVRRFMQEAKAASALNHPNIISVYDIGESVDGRFLVMELVAGRTLTEVIAEDNSLATFLPLSTQIAKTLSAAHAAGITHRDIKPDNIMVRDDGYVKVLDFGLARLLPANANDSAAATQAHQTKPGALMRTIAYMSPEQARGEAASHPSDIFALGIVLYQLATGQHPFQAETIVGYLHAITLQTPPPPHQWQPGIHSGAVSHSTDINANRNIVGSGINMAQRVMDCGDAGHILVSRHVAEVLEQLSQWQPMLYDLGEHEVKHGVRLHLFNLYGEAVGNPAIPQKLRFATDLQSQKTTDQKEQKKQILRAHTTSETVIENSIAVLPFTNMSADEENEYFCDGLAEELLNALSKIEDLKVAARTSAFSFKGKNTNVSEIGR